MIRTFYGIINPVKTKKLQKFISQLEVLVTSLEKTGQPGITPENISELKYHIIPALKETSAKFPNANDNQVGSLAIAAIVEAPWIMNAKNNEGIASMIRDDLNVTELYLTDNLRKQFFEVTHQQKPAHMKSTPRTR